MGLFSADLVLQEAWWQQDDVYGLESNELQSPGLW